MRRIADAFVAHGVLIGGIILIGAQSASVDARDWQSARRSMLQHVLTDASLETVTAIRASCAAGEEPRKAAKWRSLGLTEALDAVDSCVTALTRLGRTGTLGFVRDARGGSVSSALAFDTGFVTAYRKGDAISANLPGMGALKPVGERCLAQAEPNTKLCYSAGYAYGTRAAKGETVIVG